MKNIKFFALTGASFLCIAGFSHNSNAAGFYLQEQSVSGLGNAFAGQVATPRDSSIIYFNPAGMTHLQGTHTNVGVHIIAPSSKLTDTGSVIPFGGATGGNGGNPYHPTPVPNGSVSHEFLQDKLWIGIAVSAPFGLGSEYDENWFGRFDSTETKLSTLDIQPSFAVKLHDKVSIGGGINIQFADANLKKVVNAGAGELLSELKGDDMSIGYNVGLLYEPMEGTTFGAHYRSGVHHDLEGRVRTFSGGTALTSTQATAELDLPEIIQFGANHHINNKLSVQAGATWFGWNSFEEVRVNALNGALISNTTQNYQTTWAFNVGAEYDVTPSWTVRAGYQFDETPTTDEYRTSLTPDGDRHWISTGATYQFNDKMSLDLAATYINVSEETINVSRNSGLATVKANTDGDVGILALGLNYKF